MSRTRTHLVHLTTAALFLATALYLPFLTGQIPEIGNALCPMHLPVLLAGFFCGPLWGGLVGAAAPLLRSFLFGMPPLFPKASAMAVELMVYGFVAGFIFFLCHRNRHAIYPALVTAMLAGRAAWGCASVLFFSMQDKPFGWAYFFSEAFVLSAPAILIQLALVPFLVATVGRVYHRIADPHGW